MPVLCGRHIEALRVVRAAALGATAVPAAATETGGGDIAAPETNEYAGRWAGEKVCLVGDYDESRLYKTAYEEYDNITPALCREYNAFMRCDELRLDEGLCSSCEEHARSRGEGGDDKAG